MKLKKEKGITLIALVVTIVVLLILAGVSTNILFSDSGLIEKAQDSGLKIRAAQVEEVVANWKQSNFINSSINKQKETADKMLEDLISKKLVTEDEIDKEQEKIIIKKKDGTIIKEISYSDVEIVISKTPENEKARAVKLKVESVKGITNIKTKEDLIKYLKSLSDERKKEMLKENMVPFINKEDPTANCQTFEDVLKWMKGKEIIDNETEDAFWNYVQSEMPDDDGFTKVEIFLIEILRNLYYDETTGTMPGYAIINPDEQASSTYYATENGTYTFKVQELITGKTYSKKIEVTNIDKTIQQRYEVTSTVNQERNRTNIMLNDLIENKNVNFDKAYIIYDDRKIEISEGDIKKINENKMYVNDIYETFYSNFGFNNDEIEKVYNTTQTFILVKDGIEYEGQIYITEPKKW